MTSVKVTNVELQPSEEESSKGILSPNMKLRTSYGGGFRMLKVPGRKNMNTSSQEFSKSLKDEIKQMKQKSRELCEGDNKGKRFEGFEEFDDVEELGYHIEENKHVEDLNDLQQLQYLKEQKAKKIVEIEAEIRRIKVEKERNDREDLGTDQGFKGNDARKKQKVEKDASEYRKRFEAKFSEYLEAKKEGKVRRLEERPGFEEVGSMSAQNNNEKEAFLKWMFKKLDNTCEGFITIDQLINEVSNNLDLSQLFKIPAELTDYEEIKDYFFKIVKTLGISPESGLNLQEFFHLADLTYINREFETPQPPPAQEFKCKCLLPQSIIFLFENAFDLIMESSDSVNKFELLDSILSEEEVQENLNTPAVQISESETAELASVLHYIRMDSTHEGTDITWHEFLSYFYLSSPKIPKKCLSLFRDIFEEISNEPNSLVSTYDLVSSLLKNPQLTTYYKILHNSEETIQETINRIQDQAPTFISFHQFLSYFSSAPHPTRTSPNCKHSYLTMPEPFDFESREKSKKLSIREQKFNEMMAEKRKLEEFHRNYRPKPKPVPSSVKIPLYEQMLENHKIRSEEIKKTSIEATLQNERPFAFYLREKSKEKPRPASPPVFRFHANAIPRSSSVQIFDSMMKRIESARQEKIASRAQELLRESSLPPRMKLYSESGKSGKLGKSLVIDELSSFRASDPPDFLKLHEKFAKTLEAKKKARKSTVLEPFSIDERAEEIRERREKKKKNRNLEQNNESFPKFKAKDPPDFPKLFENFQNSLHNKRKEHEPVQVKPFAMEKRQEEMKEKKAKLEEEKKKSKKNEETVPVTKTPADLKKQENVKSLKDMLQKLINDSIEKTKAKGNDLLSKAEQKKKEAKEQSRKYKASLDQMNTRVYSRPLLVELDARVRSIKIAKGRALISIKNQLKASNISTKNYFTEEEQFLIQLAEENP